MQNAMQRLDEIVKERGPLLAGLDPDFEKIFSLQQTNSEITEEDYQSKQDFFWDVMKDFCKKYIDTIAPFVGAIKINSAFFEAENMTNLYLEVAQYAKEAGLYVIGDVKRGDIGNTSQKYAQAFLSKGSPFDAITINPYFGTDGVKPFLEMAKENGKGVFVLVKTSNNSSDEIQDMYLKDGITVYELVAELVNEWGMSTADGDEDYYLVGAVVGATYPKQAKRLREIMPKTFFLVPGYGAQGATAQDITVNFDRTGGGAIVNSSRGIMMACKSKTWKDKYSENEWREAAIAEIQRAKSELENAILCYLEA